MIADHYPGGGWIRLHESTLRALNEHRASNGLPSFDACVSELLEGRAMDPPPQARRADQPMRDPDDACDLLDRTAAFAAEDSCTLSLFCCHF